MPHDVFAFASVGRNERTCEHFGTKGPGWPLDLEELRRLFFTTPGINGAASADEWDALATFLDEAVAARVVWDDRPLDLLEASLAWRKATLRPGAWLGGVSDGDSEGVRWLRPGAGAAQLRALQWCADAVRWHEANVLRQEYSYLVFSRWDLQWLVPFPGLALLRSIHPGAVWMPCTTGDFLANDRFAVVPREHMAAYFEGWQLLVSGEVEDMFEAVLPGAGLPVYFAENTNCEQFLYARLTYAGAPLGDLPESGYVYCTPSEDLVSLRTLGMFSCTSVRELLQSGEVPASLGGAKYAIEFQNVLLVDNVVRGLLINGWQFAAHNESETPEGEQVNRLFGGGLLINWTADLLGKATFVVQQMELDRILKRGTSCADVDAVKFKTHACLAMLRRMMKLSTIRAEYFTDAWINARALVLAAPLHLEHWIWLAIVLKHPYMVPGRTAAAGAALLEAKRLNGTHPIVLSLLLSTRESLRLAASSGDQGLIEALGDANATLTLRRAQALTKRQLVERRRLQRACTDRRGGGPLPAAEGADAWFAFGDRLLREHWLTAAAGVLNHLEAEFLLDARPEVLRRRAGTVARVRDLAARLKAELHHSSHWGTWGSSVKDFRLHAPAPEELVSEAWLRRQEECTGSGGRATKAPAIRGLGWAWSKGFQQMVISDVQR